MAERVIGGVHQRLIFIRCDPVDNPGVSHPCVCRDLLLVSTFLLIGGFFGGFLLLRVPADLEGKGLGDLIARLVLICVVHRDRELRRIQSAGLQLLRRGVVGHIIGQAQSADFLQIGIYSGCIKRQQAPRPFRKVYILLAVGVAAVLLIGDAVRFRTGEPDPRHFVKIRRFIVIDHIAEAGVKIVQRIILHQIDVSVPNGDIPLRIHAAVIAQQDLPGLIRR